MWGPKVFKLTGAQYRRLHRNTTDETERTDVAVQEELELGDVPLVIAQWEVVLVVVDQNQIE